MGLARLLCAAKADEGLAAGFLFAEPGADAVLGVESDVTLYFGGEFGFGAP
jgi:hypothetical protein